MARVKYEKAFVGAIAGFVSGGAEALQNKMQANYLDRLGADPDYQGANPKKKGPNIIFRNASSLVDFGLGLGAIAGTMGDWIPGEYQEPLLISGSAIAGRKGGQLLGNLLLGTSLVAVNKKNAVTKALQTGATKPGRMSLNQPARSVYSPQLVSGDMEQRSLTPDWQSSGYRSGAVMR